MPTINYANSIIYIILDKHTRECYGSTATSLAKRMYHHREDLKAYNKWVADGKTRCQRSKCASFGIIARKEYINFELEKFPCNNKHELRAREGYYIDKYKQEVGALCVNKNREGVNSGNKKEYRKQYRKKDHVKEKEKAYRDANKEHIATKSKAWRTKPYTCPDCNKTLTLGSKSQHMRVCKGEQNLSAEQKQKQAYHKAYNQRPYTCPDCNKILTLGTKYYHTQKCKVREARLQQEQATTESLTENWWEEKESTANSPTTIVRFTNKQPLYMNTKHSVWSSVGLVFA